MEFVWILVCFRGGLNGEDSLEDDDPEFNRQADLLGESLLSVFKPDISPYENFYDSRINTFHSFDFTFMTMLQIARMQKNESFFDELIGQGVLPSYETMARETLKWEKAERLTCLLFPYLGMD